MGSYNSAETCELVGRLLLSQLRNLNINIGLYRNEGLAISNGTSRGTENSERIHAACLITMGYGSPSYHICT